MVRTAEMLSRIPWVHTFARGNQSSGPLTDDRSHTCERWTH